MARGFPHSALTEAVQRRDMEVYALFRRFWQSLTVFSAEKAARMRKKSALLNHSEELIARASFLKRKADKLHRDGEVLRQICKDNSNQRERIRTNALEARRKERLTKI